MSSTVSSLSFDSGGLRIRTPWATDATGDILVDGQVVSGKWTEDAEGHTRCRLGPWELTLEQPATGLLALRLTNTDSQPVHLDAVCFGRWSAAAFSPRLSTDTFRELVHGGSFDNLASGVKCVGRKTAGLEATAASSMFTVYQRDDGTALLLGVVPPLGQAFSELVTLHSQPHLEEDFGFEIRHRFACQVDSGACVHTAPVVALSGAGGTDLMAEFGDLWRERLQRPEARKPVSGWNSWDYYSGAITRRDMDENLSAARDLGVLDDGSHVLVIDEGWEQQWGTWEPNGKFAEGLEDYCRHVREAGWTPGIWTAPLLVNTYNPLFMAHPEWFAANADGQVCTDSYSYGPMAYLDVTRPEVIAHVESIFGRLRGLGFEYFKVDFCHCILNAERFHDARVGRAELIRRAFAAIRRAIGTETYLLSCGAPYESVAGLADAVRTTGDIHIYWGHVLRAVGSLSARWWMQGKLWNSDPDFLVVRGPDTAHEPYGRRKAVTPMGLEGGWLAGREFNATEARTYALLVHLTGGDVVLSDPLQQLRPQAREMLRAVAAPRAAAAVPVDLFESEQDLPRIWISRTDADSLVGIFNWSDKPTHVQFDPTRYGLRGTPSDFWTGQPISQVPTHMPRRSSMALRYPRD